MSCKFFLNFDNKKHCRHTFNSLKHDFFNCNELRYRKWWFIHSACWKMVCFILWLGPHAEWHHCCLLVYLPLIVLDRYRTFPQVPIYENAFVMLTFQFELHICLLFYCLIKYTIVYLLFCIWEKNVCGSANGKLNSLRV